MFCNAFIFGLSIKCSKGAKIYISLKFLTYSLCTVYLSHIRIYGFNGFPFCTQVSFTWWWVLQMCYKRAHNGPLPHAHTLIPREYEPRCNPLPPPTPRFHYLQQIKNDVVCFYIFYKGGNFLIVRRNIVLIHLSIHKSINAQQRLQLIMF